MKTIGLLCGTSWPSSIEYYKLLNQMANKHFGGFHSAKLIMLNIDYHGIKQHYPNGWDKIPAVLKTELEKLDALNPDCLLICNNTLHKGYDMIKDEIQLNSPLFHMLELTAKEASKNKYTKLLLLGTKFTMEDDFFKKHLENHGSQVVVPTLKQRDEVQAFQTKLSKGIIEEDAKVYFKDLLLQYKDVDAVVLGCTELPLVIKEEDISQKILDPLTLQCQKAFEFAIA